MRKVWSITSFRRHVRKAYSQSADADGDSHHPTILFSHIPLSRPDTASCGPLREKGSIRRGVGVGYQNTLGKKTTNWLFQNIRPCIIFRLVLILRSCGAPLAKTGHSSGDDRDYCDYSHQISSYLDIEDPAHPSVREVTVKSFSPVKYVRNPGFHLLTLVPPRQSHSDKSFKTFADSPCLLPAHLSHYRSHYLPFTFLTFIVLVLSHYRNRKQGRTPLSLRNGSLPTYYQSHQDFATSEDVTPESETWHLLEPEDLTEFPNNPYDTYSAGTGSRLSPRDPLPPTLRTPSSQAPKGLKSTTSDGGFYSVGLNTATPTTPTFRASIHSAAPIQSGFLSSSSNSVENTDQENDEDEDHMCPSYSQPPPSRSHSRRSSYALPHQSSRIPSGASSPTTSSFFPPSGTPASSATSYPQVQLPQTSFPPPPSHSHRKSRNAGWYTLSWSFVLRSRRRRMTVSFPLFWKSAFWNYILFNQPQQHQRNVSLSSGYSIYHPKKPVGMIQGTLVDFWMVIWPIVVLWCVLTWWSMW